MRSLINTFITPTGSDSMNGGAGFNTANPPGPPGSSIALGSGSFAAFITGTSPTLTLPPGNPGDLLIAVIGGGAGGTEFSPPAGWGIRHQYCDTAQHLMFAYKVREAGEVSPVFTRSASITSSAFLGNVVATGRTLPTQIDQSTHTTDTTPSASYVATGITTSVPNTLMFLATVGIAFDSINPTGAPDSSMGVLGTDGSSPALSVLNSVRWSQLFGASNGSPLQIVRLFAIMWAGQGDTGNVAYVSPSGATASTSFLLAFREPG